MAAISAHAGSISIAGAPVEFVNAPATRLGGFLSSSPEFRIAADPRNRLDPASEPLVEVDETGGGTEFSPAVPGTYAVDYLFGAFTFETPPAPGALVRVSGVYLPVFPVALVRSLSLSIANDVVELQVFGDGYKCRAVTLRDFSGELSGVALPGADLDDGAGTVSIADAVQSGAALLAEFGTGSSEVFRAWVKVPELSHKLTPGALYEHTFKFVGHAFQAAGGDFVAWGYGSP